MKLSADVMLGRLARWLRALGFDTAYDSGVTDEELVRRARSEGRLILTRDTRLAARLGPDEHLFISHNDTADQLRQTAAELGLATEPAAYLTRCLVCNSALAHADPESVRGEVPEHVFYSTEAFSRCPGCGRVYWRGTHTDKMMSRIAAALAGGGRGRGTSG